jgi:RNA polymerase sigma-B factor
VPTDPVAGVVRASSSGVLHVTPLQDAAMTRLSTTPGRDDQHHRLQELDHAADELANAAAATTCPSERAELHERLVLLALPFADAIAGRYARRGIDVEDLQQVARTALVKAVHRYRPGAGAGFTAFASPTISGEVKRWFRDHGWSVRPPRRVQELRAQLATEQERLRHVLARDPRDDELAVALGVTPGDVAEARSCSEGYRAASLDLVTPAGGTLADQVLVVGCPTAAVDLRDALAWAVSRLSPREQLILRLRFAEELTQAEIGERIGVSQMQVSRLIAAALQRLRDDLRSDLDLRLPAA